jgi:hypothetical protein
VKRRVGHGKTNQQVAELEKDQKRERPESKSPENLLAFRALGIAKVAVKKRFEPV